MPAFSAQPLSALPTETAERLIPLYDEILALLEKTNSMPFDPERDSTRTFFQTTHTDRMMAVRQVARCFQAEWQEAAAKGDRERALEMALACLRLGIMQCRNALKVDCLIGHALIGTSYAYLIPQRKELLPDEIRRLEGAVRRANAEHEPFEDILSRDVAFTERAYGWQVRLANIMRFSGSDEELDAGTLRMVDRWRAMNRLLLTDLAIRKYSRTNGATPTALAQLIPDYLDAVPLDPFSGQPLVYRLEGDDFVLYSVGKDRRDNGGRFGGHTDFFKDGFDFDLDAVSRKSAN
jgi:hypothetical protein